MAVRLPTVLCRYLKRPVVESKTARGKSAIYEGMARAIFPRSVLTGLQGVAWVEAEIDHLIEIEIKARDLGLRGKAREDFIRTELANGHAIKNGEECTR